MLGSTLATSIFDMGGVEARFFFDDPFTGEARP